MQGTYGNGRLVTVVGGSGFVGRHIVRALAARGYRIRVAVRRPDLAGFLRPLGAVGQIQPVQANIRYPESLDAATRGAVAVVNAAGILTQRGRQSFGAVHAEGAAALAERAAANGAEGFVQLSAIGADIDSDSEAARSKAAGEDAVRAAFPAATILRPSIQFGVGDFFFNRFAAIARMSPIVPLIGAETLLQPVYVGDVASAVEKSVDGLSGDGDVWELGGPEVLTFRQCMAAMLEVIQRRRAMLPIPVPIAKLAGAVLQFLPGKLLTLDQVRQLQVDNTVSDAADRSGRTLKGLGIQPTALEVVLPNYLARFRAHGEFSRQRNA